VKNPCFSSDCFSSGRYTVSYSNNVLNYGSDKVHYTDATFPGEIKDHFANMERHLQTAMVDHKSTAPSTCIL
jgi:hypothetical protein